MSLSEEKPKSKSHADYEKNLVIAQKFLAKHACKTHVLDRRLLEIGMREDGKIIWFYLWSVYGNYAQPVTLHQPEKQFLEELKSSLSDYKIREKQEIKLRQRQTIRKLAISIGLGSRKIQKTYQGSDPKKITQPGGSNEVRRFYPGMDRLTHQMPKKAPTLRHRIEKVRV